MLVPCLVNLKKKNRIWLYRLRWDIILSLCVNILSENPVLLWKMNDFSSDYYNTWQNEYEKLSNFDSSAVHLCAISNISPLTSDVFQNELSEKKKYPILRLFSPGQSTNSVPRNIGQWSNQSMYRTHSFLTLTSNFINS